MTWQPELDELRRREALAERMGGPEKIGRQRDAGRLTGSAFAATGGNSKTLGGR